MLLFFHDEVRFMGASLAIRPALLSASKNLSSGPLGKHKSAIITHSLLHRVTNNWKVIMMGSSAALAVVCCVAAFFSGSPALGIPLVAVAIASGAGTFHIRQLSRINDLEATAKGLKESKERFETLATTFQTENQRLVQTNQDLQQTNESLRVTNQELQRTNDAFQATNRDLQTTNRDLQATNDSLRQINTRLTTQVAQLTLQVTQLRESAERIKSEVVRFQQENAHLHHNVNNFDQSLRTLDQQILGSRALCDQIAGPLPSQQQGLGEQLGQLRQYLSDLRADNRIHERIQEWSTLQQQVRQATDQLHQIQLQYATERANFQAVHESLVQLKNQFDTAIREAVSSLSSNNQQYRNNLASNQEQFQNNINQLTTERERIQQMLERYASRVP